MRYRAGIVTDEMLAIPKWRFAAIGILEALGVATGMSAGGIGICLVSVIEAQFTFLGVFSSSSSTLFG